MHFALFGGQQTKIIHNLAQKFKQDTKNFYIAAMLKLNKEVHEGMFT